MKRVKSIKIKNKYRGIFRIVGIVFCVLLGVFIFYNKEIGDLTKFGYSRSASRRILFSFKKDYVLSKGENKTLNEAFMSKYYKEKYLDHYSKIDYVKQKNFIKNINKLIEIGYTNDDINIIFKHGDDGEVTRFTKRKKIKYLDEFFSVDYARLDNYDRYVKYSDETGEDDEYVVMYVNLDLDKEVYKDVYHVKKFSYDMLVNKHRGLSKDFKPKDLIRIDSKYTNGEKVYANRKAISSFISMSRAMESEGLGLTINSGYRSYSDQEDIVKTYQDLYGEDYVNKFVARAGFSEHQTGLAFDFGSKSSSVFLNSKEYEWMQDNAYKYGFILRFPKRYEDITQFRSEPWHYRYVGRKIAKYIHDKNITLEEYYVMFLGG